MAQRVASASASGFAAACASLQRRLTARLRMIVGRKFPGLTRAVNVRGQTLRGPFGHQLDFYTSCYPFYDFFLPALCEIVSASHRDGQIADIGANIGDTIALIRQRGVRNRIVAIEASPKFFAMLEDNVRHARELFGDVRLVKAFVGSSRQNLVLEYTAGTARTKVAGAASAAAAVPTVSMEDLSIESVALVKVDTDGYDGAILKDNLGYFVARRPVIWAETFVDGEQALQDWSSALTGLVGSYECFYLFDNAGRPTLAGELDAGLVETILQLIRAAWIARTLAEQGRGASTLAYYDIALVPQKQSQVWREFREFVDREVQRAAGVAPMPALS